MKDILEEQKNLENALAGLIGELKPAPFPPANATEHWSVELDGTEETNSRWRTYMSAALKTAKTFEIHCWTEETAVSYTHLTLPTTSRV